MGLVSWSGLQTEACGADDREQRKRQVYSKHGIEAVRIGASFLQAYPLSIHVRFTHGERNVNDGLLQGL